MIRSIFNPFICDSCLSRIHGRCYISGVCRSCAEYRWPAICHACRGLGWVEVNDAHGMLVYTKIALCLACQGWGELKREAS